MGGCFMRSLPSPGSVAEPLEVYSASRLAAASSLNPSLIAPSLLSGARMQTSAASTTDSPAAMSFAAVTSTRVEGGAK